MNVYDSLVPCWTAHAQPWSRGDPGQCEKDNHCYSGQKNTNLCKSVKSHEAQILK